MTIPRERCDERKAPLVRGRLSLFGFVIDEEYCLLVSGCYEPVSKTLPSPNVFFLAFSFVAAGIAIGCIETSQHTAVASFAPSELRGSAFGFLAAVQSFGNIVASALAAHIPQFAFAFFVRPLREGIYKVEFISNSAM